MSKYFSCSLLRALYGSESHDRSHAGFLNQIRHYALLATLGPIDLICVDRPPKPSAGALDHYREGRCQLAFRFLTSSKWLISGSIMFAIRSPRSFWLNVGMDFLLFYVTLLC